MLDIWKAILLLVVGAALSYIPTWIESNRSRKRTLEDRKLERAIAAREIRLKEGEEIAKRISSNLFQYYMVIVKLFGVESIEDLRQLNKTIDLLTKVITESDEGQNVYISSIKSLEDKELTKAWEETTNSLDAYVGFGLKLREMVVEDGVVSPKKYEKQREEEIVLRREYYSSIEKFLKRINELRAQ
ncbi:MAG TPA: hypothetical protein VF318_01975 [Dehalococcoidales bacterium]